MTEHPVGTRIFLFWPSVGLLQLAVFALELLVGLAKTLSHLYQGLRLSLLKPAFISVGNCMETPSVLLSSTTSTGFGSLS